jgi:hypothetical protein
MAGALRCIEIAVGSQTSHTGASALYVDSILTYSIVVLCMLQAQRCCAMHLTLVFHDRLIMGMNCHPHAYMLGTCVVLCAAAAAGVCTYM